MKKIFANVIIITICSVLTGLAGIGSEAGAGSQSPPVTLACTDVPEMIHYQGVLRNEAGTPLDTIVTMTFTIYDAPTGGTALWTETHGFVTIIGGLLDILLGDGIPIPPDVFEEPTRWLGVAIGADHEMEPRQQIVSSAYAYRARKADETDVFDGQDAAEFAGASHGHDAPEITSGILDDARIPSGIARDTEMKAVITNHHAEASTDHDDRYYTEDELNITDGNAPNSGSNRVHWNNLRGVPSVFADGNDAEATLIGVTRIDAGTGIAVMNPTGPISTVSADIGSGADQTAAGNHDHDGDYINDGGGDIDEAADFGFSSSTFITNLDADLLDGAHASDFAQTIHTHSGSDFTSGTIGTDYFSAYEDLTTEGKIGTDAGQVSVGDHAHDGDYMNDDNGEIDAVGDFGFFSPTFVTNLDADLLDGQEASAFANVTHDHDTEYINDGAGEIDAANDFNLSSPTFVSNLDADLLEGKQASELLSLSNDWGRSGVAIDLYEGTTALMTKYLGISDQATDTDQLDGLDTGELAQTTHNHSGDDIASGTVGTDYFSAYDDLSAEGKIGTGISQVAVGDHAHDVDYIIDGAGEIDGAGDFGFSSSTFVTNLDVDLLDGQEASAFASATHSHDADYIDDGAGEIDAANDFNLSSPTFVTNLDADLLDGKQASEMLSLANDWGRSDVAINLYEGSTTLSVKYLGISDQATDTDELDGHDSAEFAQATHTHNGSDITSGTIGIDFYSAYTDLSTEGKIGTGASQVAPGVHDHDATYINDGTGEIDAATDFGLSSSTFITNLDADFLDGKNGSDFVLAAHDHDADYINTTGPETITGGYPHTLKATNDQGHGMYGESSGNDACGVYGKLLAANPYQAGVYGTHDGDGPAIIGECSGSNSIGVYGYAKNGVDGYNNGWGHGGGTAVTGECEQSNGIGVKGYSNGAQYAVYGKGEGSATNTSGGYFWSDAYRGLYAQGGGGHEAAYLDGNVTVKGNLTADDNVSGSTLTSTVATGTAPLTVSSTTLVTNLNADLLDDLHASDFAGATHHHDADYVNEGQSSSVTSDMIVNGTIQSGDLSFTLPDGHSLDAADGSPTGVVHVDNAGNVGIGTTSPGYKLDVSGDINTTGDIRKSDAAYTHPDYVFEPAYPLMSLEELQALVTTEKHLLNMPSAEEVMTKGIEMFEQNRLLLEKLEEAYLYVFQLEACMDQLSKRMVMLEKAASTKGSAVE